MATMENKLTGYISLYRSIMTHWTYPHGRKFTEFEAWIDLLLAANFEKKKIYFDNQLREVERGQFLTSLDKLSRRWMWSVGAVRHFIDVLQKDEMIVKTPSNKCTQITICNYDSYQTPQQAKSTQKAGRKHTESTQKATDNNSNKLNNEINIPFDDFWDLYDKKVGELEKLQGKWSRLTDNERSAAMLHIPKYKISQPEKKYRKNPETYLNNKSWNDEIIGASTPKPFVMP